jgi:hypothetical protein
MVRIAGVAVTVAVVFALSPGCYHPDSGSDVWFFSPQVEVWSDTLPTPIRTGVQVCFDYDKVDMSHEVIPNTGERWYGNTNYDGFIQHKSACLRGYRNGLYYEGIRAVVSTSHGGKTVAETLYEDGPFRNVNPGWYPACILRVHSGSR